jgi:AcrR family transcriptional regulator
MIEERRADTREKPGRRGQGELLRAIQGAAARLFAERGFAAVSMRDICQEAGVSPSGLYRHFKDKNDLYLSCVLSAYKEVEAKVRREVAHATTTPAKIFVTTASVCEAYLSESHVSRLLMRQLLERDYAILDRVSHEVISSASEELTSQIAAFAPGVDAHATAHAIYAMAFGFGTLAPMSTMMEWETTRESDHGRHSRALAVRILSLLFPAHDWRRLDADMAA